MKKTLHILLVLLSLMAVPRQVNASHIVGGEIYYDYLGSNSYRFYVVLFRDCYSTGAEYDDPLSLGIYDQSGNLISEELIQFPGSTVLTVLPPNACVTAPADICTERAIYVRTIVLPPRVGGYTVAYQRCCRTPDILNIVNPDDTGLTIQAKIPGVNTGNHLNSSPRFVNYPPLVICNNTYFEFDHSATDPDGDELVYSLATPNHGASDSMPAPQPPPPPPYSPIIWDASAGFNQTDQLGANASISIDPTTGQLQAHPSLLGLFVVGIKVSEYRNGVLVGETIRDFLFKVVNCNFTMKALLPAQEQMDYFEGYCDPTIIFDNNSFGAQSYSWDFGVPGINSDVSNDQYPTYTYPYAGNFVARVIANNSNGCIDTAYIDIRIDEVLSPDFQFTDSICFVGNSFDLLGSHGTANTASYLYTFPPEANMTTSTNQDVFGLSFNQAGTFAVNLKVTGDACDAEITKSITTLPLPTADFFLPENYECGGLTVNFFDNSTHSNQFSWDFGVQTEVDDTSNLNNPSYTFSEPGIYSILLIAGSTGACFDTIEQVFEVYKDLIIDFQNDDSLCFTDNSFDFLGLVDGPDFTNYTWDFGPNSQPTTSNDTNVFGVHFTQPGMHFISLRGNFLQCEEKVEKSVFLYAEPQINFDIVKGLQCLPATVQFINNSSADTPMSFEWDFGDGLSSTESAPTHIYGQEGNFSVTLTLTTAAGCIDTLNLTRDDLIDIQPVPTSLFYPSTTEANICASEVIFYDQSEGASSISYSMDDGGSAIPNAPAQFSYTFKSSGYKNIIQTATNTAGCSATSQSVVYIEPFSVFVPNSFTPDQNEHNNSFNAVSFLEAEEWHLRIYNRWGDLIFESFDQSQNWDGTFEGVLLKSDVFIYVIDLVACGEEDKYRTLKGHVNLIR